MQMALRELIEMPLLLACASKVDSRIQQLIPLS